MRTRQEREAATSTASAAAAELTESVPEAAKSEAVGAARLPLHASRAGHGDVIARPAGPRPAAKAARSRSGRDRKSVV